MEQVTSTHTLKAWTMDGDIIPTLYIQGEIPTNGERPMVELLEKMPPPIAGEKTLGLEFNIDVYDPKGEQHLHISNYEKKLVTTGDYKKVQIFANKGTIELDVEIRSRH